MLVQGLQTGLCGLSISGLVLDEPVAAHHDLARQEVVDIRERSLLAVRTLVEGECNRHSLIVEGNLLLRGILHHADQLVVVIVVRRRHSHITCGGVAQLGLVGRFGIVAGVGNLSTTGNGVIRISGITHNGNQIAGILHGHLQHGTLSDLHVVAVHAERSAIGLDGHLQTVLLDGLHLAGIRLGREFHQRILQVRIAEVPRTLHVLSRRRALRTFRVLRHLDGNQILALVLNLHIALGHLVGRSIVRGNSLGRINATNGIGKVRCCVARHFHHVVRAHHGHLEYDAVTGLDTVAVVADGLSVGIHGQQHTVLLDGLNGSCFTLSRECSHCGHHILVGKVPRGLDGLCPAHQGQHQRQAQRAPSK